MGVSVLCGCGACILYINIPLCLHTNTLTITSILQYDSKILQLQKQSSAVNLSGGGPSINSDIFRKVGHCGTLFVLPLHMLCMGREILCMV